MYKKLASFLYQYVPSEEVDWWKTFKQLAIVSLVFHLLAVIFSEGYHRPDEHLGMVRYIALKLGVWSHSDLLQVNWEYKAQIRPWLQPAFYFSILKGLDLFGINSPYTQMFFLRLFSSLLGMLSLIPLALSSFHLLESAKARKFGLYLLFGLWFLPFFHARTTAENLGISFFLFGIAPFILNMRRKDWSFQGVKPILERNLSVNLFLSFLCGLSLGTSFILRYQMIVMIASTGLFLLLFSRVQIKSLLSVILGILAMQGLGVLIDYWGYGNWVFTPWNYFDYNILRGVASGFGVSPWYYYFTKTLAKGVPPLSLVFIIPFVWLWLKRPLHFLTWMTLPYLAVHSFIGHKELRFVFALGLFIPLVAPLMMESMKQNILKKKLIKVLISLAIFENILLLFAASLKPAYSPLAFYRHLYQKETPIEKIYVLAVFRDQLSFYLKKPYEQVLVKDLEEVKTIVTQETNNWFLTNKYIHIQDFRKMKQCREDYISYPNWVFHFNIGNWMKRSKIWALYRCSKE